ncbi:hypothetical protein XENORESO_011045 [Xenotaenia resolanae]|uniref:Uncharacterized protein n=1 Tax=Xenotaenia resolanae TaxID=208358 RepID=A0ABV0W3E1_9TELE
MAFILDMLKHNINSDKKTCAMWRLDQNLPIEQKPSSAVRQIHSFQLNFSSYNMVCCVFSETRQKGKQLSPLPPKSISFPSVICTRQQHKDKSVSSFRHTALATTTQENLVSTLVRDVSSYHAFGPTMSYLVIPFTTFIRLSVFGPQIREVCCVDWQVGAERQPALKSLV